MSKKVVLLIVVLALAVLAVVIMTPTVHQSDRSQDAAIGTPWGPQPRWTLESAAAKPTPWGPMPRWTLTP